jgi:hypothetical protein
MKRWLIIFMLIIMIATMIAPTITLAYTYYCPTCDMMGIWTGETKYDWGHTFWLYKCINKHYWWERQF